MSLVENESRLRQAARQIRSCLHEAESQLQGTDAGTPKNTNFSRDQSVAPSPIWPSVEAE
jgi:hypothetical protein